MQLVVILFFSLLLIQSSVPPLLFAQDDDITVMTQNQYLGVDLTDVVASASNPVALNHAILEALAQIKASKFPERVKALAKEIVDNRPEVVGLQEVTDFKLNGQNGDPPYRDHLADTLNALTALGEEYVVAASVRNLSGTLPVDFDENGVPDAALTAIDRDVILVRADVVAAAVPFSSVCSRPSSDGGPGCNYQTVAQANTAVGLIKFERGFVGVDVMLNNKLSRVVNTHLEVREPDPTDPLSPLIQAAQMKELLSILDATTPVDRSLIILGDINSSPEDQIRSVDSFTIVPPYQQLSLAGYTDTWTVLPDDPPGFTCCQSADLLNLRSLLNERIDVIFSDIVPDKVNARVVGAELSDKSRPLPLTEAICRWNTIIGAKISDKNVCSRLWPSDHAAVVAGLDLADR